MMKGRQRIRIKNDADWEDVTDRYAVIYGAGQGCIDMMSEFQLPDVKYVIDSDRKKWGKQIILLDRVYFVQSPEVLSELPQEDYYLVISSERYANEIKKNINNYLGGKKIIICMNRECLAFLYDSLEDLLFYDPKIKKSLISTNWSRNTDRLIQLFSSTVKELFQKKIDFFMAIWNGISKLSFCFCVEKQLYVFSIPALYCESSFVSLPYNHKLKERKLRYQFRKKYDIGNELTVYEDDSGVLIQVYTDPFVDFENEKCIQCVLEKSYKLHQLDDELNVQYDFLNGIYQAARIDLLKTAPWEHSKVDELDIRRERIFSELSRIKIKQKICHGDLDDTNVVLWKDSVFLIDWEYMSMTDPMYDVCRFLYSTGVRDCYKKNLSFVKASEKIYAELRHHLSLYFGGKCSDEEYYHAYLTMQAIECATILRSGVYTGHIEEERYEDLLNRLMKE